MTAESATFCRPRTTDDQPSMMPPTAGPSGERASGSGSQQRRIYCPINGCTFSTKRLYNFTRHTRALHNTCEKPMECCQRQFNTKAELRDHRTIVHSDGYDCPVCDRRFKRKTALSRHETTHTGVKIFSCDLCKYRSSSKGNVKRHRKSCHNNIPEIDNTKEKSTKAPNCDLPFKKRKFAFCDPPAPSATVTSALPLATVAPPVTTAKRTLGQYVLFSPPSETQSSSMSSGYNSSNTGSSLQSSSPSPPVIIPVQFTYLCPEQDVPMDLSKK